MKKFLSVLISIMIISSYITVAHADVVSNDLLDENDSIFLELGDNKKEINFSSQNYNKLPKYVSNVLENNKDFKLVESKIYHYRIEKVDGNVNQKLIKSFNIEDDNSLNEYELYRENYNLEETIPEMITPLYKPREDMDIFLGISAYSFSHPTKPTAYQIQGWWEWDPAGLGVFSSRWNIVGLNFQGETMGYDYDVFANNVHTGAALSLDLVGSDDNGVAFQHTQSPLSEGALLGKIISSNSNTNERFRVSFIYEFFDSNPNSSYLRSLIDYIIGYIVSIPPMPSDNARFINSTNLYYGR